MTHKHHLLWLVIFTLIALMFLRLPPMVAQQDSVLSTYRALVEVDALAHQQYVEPILDDRLVDGALRGMMQQLDPYSGYVAPDELSGFERRSSGEYVGLGLEIGQKDGQPVVIASVEGSPAARAGIHAGDVILTLDGRETDGLSIFEIDERLSRRVASSVHLVVSRAGQVEKQSFTVVRGPVSIPTVRGYRRMQSGNWDYFLDPERGIAYIRISSFCENTFDALKDALDELGPRRPRGLILDLRFNPGGLLEQAVALVDAFVDEGVIVSTVTRRQAVREYEATAGSSFVGLKLAVLINGGSASASEIVAGSLQDHHRALIVGERSFGKGSVQHLIHLRSNASAIKLTIAYYRLPGGRIIHRSARNMPSQSWGVQPDIVVSLTADEVLAIQESRRALDLSGGETSASSEQADGATPMESPPSPSSEILRDRQLLAAMEVLAHSD